MTVSAWLERYIVQIVRNVQIVRLGRRPFRSSRIRFRRGRSSKAARKVTGSPRSGDDLARLALDGAISGALEWNAFETFAFGVLLRLNGAAARVLKPELSERFVWRRMGQTNL